MFASPLVFAIALALAILLGASAIGTAAYSVLESNARRTFLRRALGSSADASAVGGHGWRGHGVGANNVLLWALLQRLSSRAAVDGATTARLRYAGFHGEMAYAYYVLAQLIGALIPVLLIVTLAEVLSLNVLLLTTIGAAAGSRVPNLVVSQRVTQRQEAVRRAIPDALDLLVVCVEAGAALDASLHRIARELSVVHPLLASELRGISRRIAAGQARHLALQTPYERTGVEELKGLASHIAQSERWGTSIATVLRVYAEQIRQKQRVYAERRAATASSRMLLPLALFIFPTIFVALLGPALMRISTMFANMQ